MVLSKKPSGPNNETMLASIVEIGAIGTDPKKMTYVVRYFQKPFSINRALRASPKEIEKMSKDQMMAKVKRYVLSNLGLGSGSRTVHSQHTTLPAAKRAIETLLRKLQSR